VNRRITQKIDKQDIDYCKKWLCDDTPINVRQGLDDILSNNNPFYALKELQLRHVGCKLMKNLIPAMNTITDSNGGVVKIDDVITLHGILGYTIRSRVQFVKLIYQSVSCFPTALYEAYREITGESLKLDDLAEIREFYEHCSQIDLWTAQEFCAYISHCSPEALNFIFEHPEMDFMSNDTEAQQVIVGKLGDLLSETLSFLLLRPDLYERNLAFLKPAILGGAFEIVLLDSGNWEKSSLLPKKGLEWAKKKGIEYHPVLDEYLLVSDTTPVISSGYSTPYLEMMQQVIREEEITRENQGKKESLTASFAKKLDDHKLTRPSQKLADAMATLVRMPESQQGRAKAKG